MESFWNRLLSFFLPVAPEVDLDASVKERIVVHAGGVIRIIAYVSGQPSPDVTWSRDGAALPPEAKVETTAISSSLVIKPCTRKHLGVYTLTAKNAGGEKTKKITVEVLGNTLFSLKWNCWTFKTHRNCKYVFITFDCVLLRCSRASRHPLSCREPEQ